MKIVIDATALLLPSAGVRNYFHYWLRSLLDFKRHDERITTYPLSVSVPSQLNHERSVAGKTGTWVRLNLTRFLNTRGNPAINFAVLGSDVFHSSQHAAKSSIFTQKLITAALTDDEKP